MKYLGLLAGKIALIFGKILKRGSSLPGYLAIRISPDILKKIKYPKDIIVVTGTNGKTSTANLLAEILENAGKKVVHNTKGANMMSGLVTAIIEKTGFLFNMKADVLLLEVDESTVPLFFKSVNASQLVVTNFFRDQLDRHGEIDVLIKTIAESTDEKTQLVLNGNDPFVYSLSEYLPDNPAVYYGMEKTEYGEDGEMEVRETKLCPRCSKELEYEYYHYSQIGNFKCECGFSTPELKYMATDLDLKKKSFKVNGEEYKSRYDNMYFVFNTLGAIASAKEMNIEYETIKKTVFDFEIGEGRMESVNIGEYATYLNLVKNPAGLNQSINYILNQDDEKFSVFMSLTNKYADGIDTSWIWDSQFEKLIESGLDKFICSGPRAYDLAVRLKYAGISEDKLVVLPDLEEAVGYLKDHVETKPYLLSSYSSLQPIRKIIKEDKK